MLLKLMVLILQAASSLLAQRGTLGSLTGPDLPVAAVNQNVTYTCTASGTLVWAVNGRQALTEDRRNEFAQSGIFVPLERDQMSVAMIDPSRVNDTEIECILFGTILQGAQTIGSFNFTTYGTPSPPSDLVTQDNITQRGYMLSWTPGFMFLNENQSFVITARSGSTSEMYSTVSTSIFVPTPASGQTCLQYELLVVSQNEVGVSNTSLQTQVLAPTSPAPLEAHNILTSVSLMNNMASINVSFKDPSPCSKFRVVQYNLTVYEVANSVNGILSSPMLIMISFNIKKMPNMITIMMDRSSGILPDRKYVMTLAATNNVASSQVNLSISTTGLLGASIVVNTGLSDISINCTFAEGSSALGCVAVSDAGTELVRAIIINVDGIATNTASLLPGADIDNIVVAEVLQSGAMSAIHINTSIQIIATTQLPSVDSTTEEVMTESSMEQLFISTSATELIVEESDPTTEVVMMESSTNLLSVTTTATESILEGYILYVIVGGIVVVLLLLILIVVVILVVIHHCHKKSKVVMFNCGEELKTTNDYGGRESISHIYDTDELANLKMGKLAQNNTYDTADPHLCEPSNGKLSAPIPTYATIEMARKEMLQVGGPAVLNPVYGPGSSLSPATSPMPTPLSISKQASNPIYSESPNPRQIPVVSGLNPVYGGGMGSVTSSLHSDVSPRYTNSPDSARPPSNTAFVAPCSPGNGSSPPVPPLYEELKPVKLMPVPSQRKNPVPSLTSNESYGVLNGKNNQI